MSFKGQILWAVEKDVFIAANQSVKVLAKSIWEMGIKSTKEDFVYASLKMKEGQIESHLLLEPERNLKFFPERLERKVHQSKDGLDVELYSPVFVKSVILEVPGENVEFSDNFFDLVPWVKKRIRLTCSSEKEGIIRDRLNIT